MERKDYVRKFLDIKNEILHEIHQLIPEGSTHRFNETFFIHYIEGEVATTEVCTAIEVRPDCMVVFIVNNRVDINKFESVEGTEIFQYDPDSFIDILEHLKKEIRENKLRHLREIVEKNGSRISFDGTFWYKPTLDVGEFETKLTGLSLNSEKGLIFSNVTQGETFSDGENTINIDELDRIIEYVEKQTMRKFVVRVSGSFSRCFEIEASTYEEALAEAKKDWETNPLYYGDSNGEDWEDYTSLAH